MYRKLLNLSEAISRSGLSGCTLRILAYLGVKESATHATFAADLAINPASLPRYLSRLIKSGHVSTMADPSDGRAVNFTLTAHGGKLVKSLALHFEEKAETLKS